MTPNMLYDKISNSEYFPQIPNKLSIIFNVLADPNKIDLNSLFYQISKLPKLEEGLLTFINAGYFKLPKILTSVSEAYRVLGLQNLRNFLILCCVKSIIPDSFGKAKIFNRHAYWEHTVGVTITCNILADLIKYPDPYFFSPFGLIHDIGVVLLDRCAPFETDQIITLINQGVPPVTAEKEILGGLTHADVGAWLAKKWRLPPEFISAIQHHHFPQEADSFQPEISLICLADALSQKYYEKMDKIKLDPPLRELILNKTGIKLDDIKEIITVLPILINENKHYFDILYAAEELLPDLCIIKASGV